MGSEFKTGPAKWDIYDGTNRMVYGNYASEQEWGVKDRYEADRAKHQ
jgi:hypothetical protein